ncbi:hypothetical protein MKEN_01485700 [Mycena kentingensis (nom. inval.)]|nr:hypothetical protein MKEN_01485700 [Mycena kentingensis (nom. inval.)]
MSESLFDGGLRVSPRMAQIIAQPDKHLKAFNGGQELRNLTRAASAFMDPKKLSPFALAVFTGNYEAVKQAVELFRPDLSATETPHKHGYASWAVLGAQRMQEGAPGMMRHLETLDYLLSQGTPPDVPDIQGYTAFQHSTTAPQVVLELTKCLVKHGANVNHQNRYGAISLIPVMMSNAIPAVEFLLEHGADLDIPEADGVTVRNFYVRCGPQVSAAVTKWIKKRAGEEAAPRGDGRVCDGCRKKAKVGVDLKSCGRCKVARYCAVECQKKAWPTHKPNCVPFSSENTVTLKPSYHAFANTIPVAEVLRGKTGYPTNEAAFSANKTRGSHVPKNLKDGKALIVKVQVPVSDDPVRRVGDIMVYTKKRDFAAAIKREDGAEAYDKISEVIRTKTVSKVKGYFAAELEAKDRLVVKVGEVLADQPW